MKKDLAGRKVLVVGLAKSGVSAARLLISKGAKVTCADKRTNEELGDTAKELEKLGAVVKGGNPGVDVYTSAELIVVSPGVPLANPEVVAAKQAGVQVVGEVELASWFLPGNPTFLGITGTNGKSTTTALLGTLCTEAGFRTFTGGNLGKPLADAAMSADPWHFVVCELSSFQLEGIESLRPKVACITNLTPDHIDRYASHEAYGEAKRRIFMNQTADDFAVVNSKEDGGTVFLAKGVKSQVKTFGTKATDTARIEDTCVVVNLGHGDERYIVRNRALRGAHNLENAAAAVLLARLGGVQSDMIQLGLDRYPGLAHRMEYAGTVNGVEYINDSKATNVDSSLVALKAFDRGVWLIAGGLGKGLPYTPLVELGKGRLKGVLTIGEDAGLIEKAFLGTTEIIPCGDLATAVKTASRRSTPGDVVLLSPACASYDQFNNFEHRGEVFKTLVQGLLKNF